MKTFQQKWDKKFEKLKIKGGYVCQCPQNLASPIEDRSFGTTNSLGIEEDIDKIYTAGINDGLAMAMGYIHQREKALLKEIKKEIEKSTVQEEKLVQILEKPKVGKVSK